MRNSRRHNISKYSAVMKICRKLYAKHVLNITITTRVIVIKMFKSKYLMICIAKFIVIVLYCIVSFLGPTDEEKKHRSIKNKNIFNKKDAS